MTPAQTLYLVVIGIYVIFFLLFARFFIWKRYADRRYWRRRPALSVDGVRRMAEEKDRELPFISILVPARNEAEVIGRTIDHLCGLNYDPSRYEIVVATDEKESRAREGRRLAVLSAAAALLDDPSEHHSPDGPLGEAGEVVLALLARLAVTDYIAGRREYRRLTLHMTQESGEPELVGPVTRHVTAVETLARWLVKERRPLPLAELRRTARVSSPHTEGREADTLASVHLALAVPVAVAFGLVTDGAGQGATGQLEPSRVVLRTGQAREEVTARVLTVMSGIIARSLATRVESERASGRLGASLNEAYTVRFPTTQDVVEERIAARAVSAIADTPAGPAIKHVVVPFDADGSFPGTRTGGEVSSTKGRALNWALSHTDRRSTVYGFYDAESRPHQDVLLYVAWRRLQDDPSAAILQGPVFQVRNFYRMGAFCKLASLYQAIAHDWYLPALFRRLPFVGGTNLFVDRALLERAGGFDPTSLTEDLELGVRAYLKCGAWPDFLPYPSSEQTPPTLPGFFRQRIRWGVGHLQVMDKVRRAEGYDLGTVRRLLRTLWVKGQFEWVLYQTATLVPPTVIILYLTGNIEPYVIPDAVRYVLNTVGLVYPCFTFYAYFRYLSFMDRFDQRELSPGRKAAVFLQLLLLPLAAFFFPVPYTTALALKKLGREPRHWVKTPRTAE